MSWKEEFFELYSTDGKDNFSRALDMKLHNIPKKLYRYRSVTDNNLEFRKDEIVYGDLYLSHPDEFNDPFEASSLLSGKKSSDYLNDRALYQNHFAHIPEDDYHEIFDAEDWYDRLLRYGARNEKSITEEQYCDIMDRVVMSEIEKLNEAITDTARKMNRIASFTTKSYNLPMWNHYANEHRGICLEYDTDDIQIIYQKNRLFPVVYMEQLPDITCKMFHKESPQFTLFSSLAIQKLKDWSYEDEWRMVFDAGSWYFGPEDVPKSYWSTGKTIRFIKPSKVILGYAIAQEHETAIRSMAQSVGIPVEKAKVTTRGLVFEK